MDQLAEYQFVIVLMWCLSMESFCCCISLEVGAKVVSIVSTLMSAVIMVLYSSAALLLQLSQLKTMFYAAMSLSAGLQFLAGILLCFGVFQGRPKIMWPWLLVALCSGFCLLGVSIAGYVALVVVGGLTSDANLVISAYVVYSLFLLYCAFVVQSRRLELIEEKNESESATTLMTYSTAFKYAYPRDMYT